MRTGQYILDDQQNAIAEPNVVKWAEWFCNNPGRRQVLATKVGPEAVVSTVFLGLDHNYGDGPPILFESMVFGGEHDSFQMRYCTMEEAKSGHEYIVSKLQTGEAL